MLMRPFLQASAAMLRVLKIRAAQSHLSSRASPGLLIVWLFFIVLVHREVDAAETETLDHLSGDGHALVELCLLLGREMPEDVIDLSAAWKVIADAESEAGILLGTEHGSDVAQTIVPSLASGGFHAKLSEREREVVDHDEKPIDGYVLRVQPVAHSIAAEVHVGRRLEQGECLVFHPHVCHESIAAVCKNSIGRLRKGVQYRKSYVVAGVGIFIADVA